ncbi:MAG: class II fructose-bisphosphate aldolase [Patescibacteria group bacterium]
MHNSPASLRDCIKQAEEKKIAIGHFNISNLEALWAIFNAARALDLPVIIGLSEGERDFVGVRQAVALVKSFKEEFNYPIFLNADHTYSFERVKEVIDAGYDAVIFDGAKLSFEENIAIAKQCVDYARSVNPEIIIEAELGYIGQSSKILDAIPEGVGTPESLTTPEQAKEYVERTGIDLLAPAVGNIHGMLAVGHDPKLDIARIKSVREAAQVPLVLHGGSGISDEDFKKAIEAGISIVHINTEIRVAFRDAVKKSLQDYPDEVAPYRIMKGSVIEIQRVVTERLKLFSNL